MTLRVTCVFALYCLDIIRCGRVIQWGKLQGVFVFSILAVTVCPIPCIGLCTVCMVQMVWMKKKNTSRCFLFIFYPVSEKFIFNGHKNTILSAAILCLTVSVVSGRKQCRHVAEVLNTSQPMSFLLFPDKEWTSMAMTRAAQIQRRKYFFYDCSVKHKAESMWSDIYVFRQIGLLGLFPLYGMNQWAAGRRPQRRQ